jgi:hypothetical protein
VAAVTVDDVLKAARDRWLAGPLSGRPLMAVQPFPGQGPPEYLILSAVENAGRERDTGGRVWQGFELTAEYWTSVVPTDTKEAVILALFGGTVANPGAGLVLPAGKSVRRSFAKGPVLTRRGQNESGKDIYSLACKFDVKTEATE